LFQLQPAEGKTTVQFDVLISAASAIQKAKDNCQDAGSASMSKLSGQESGGKKLNKCWHCNLTTHSDKGFGKDICEKFCKAAKHKGKLCKGVGHFPDCCKKGKAEAKKAKLNALTTEDPAGEVAAAPAPPAEAAAESGAQAAALNSIKQVQPYRFDPERYQGYKMEDCGWWSLEALTPRPIQKKRVWARMEAMSLGPALVHFLFDNVSRVWRSASPPSHAAKHVQIELDRGSYAGTGVKKPQKKCRKVVDTWGPSDTYQPKVGEGNRRR
jgi:hypothetical protein